MTLSQTDAMLTPNLAGRLDATKFVVIGEGLAAGMANFSLARYAQAASFPAQVARQMGAPFRQPVFQDPGLGHAPGFPELPVTAPALTQTTIYDQLPPAPFSNLSVPGFTLSDALHVRPSEPLVRRNNAKQTLANMILTPLEIVHGKKGQLRTQLECALHAEPTFTIVELGYYEALDAAIHSNPERLPGTEAFGSDYDRILSALRSSGSEVLLLTVPDPTDTAYLSPLHAAAEIVKVELSLLTQVYGLPPDAWISVDGLSAIGFQLLAGQTGPLPAHAIARGRDLGEISSRIALWNQALFALGRQHQAAVYDLHGLFRRIAAQGMPVGTQMLTAGFLGGFYSLNGCYPGATGHAVIANELLCFLNRHYGTAFPMAGVVAIAAEDRTSAHRAASGPGWNTQDLLLALASKVPFEAESTQEADIEARQHSHGAHATWGDPSLVGRPSTLPSLQIPPGGRQILRLNSEESYVGDTFSMLDCENAAEAQWGSGGERLFGGFGMTDSHLRGYIQITFTPPVNGVTQFTVSFGNGLAGDDSSLVAPYFYRFPILNTRVLEIPGQVATGTLNLATHEVSDLKLDVSIINTGLLALAGANPGFPQQPVSFPGQYGSTWAEFEQRDDGNLDFRFHGTTFLPLGEGFGRGPLRLPLPFAGPSMQFATILCRGNVLHPHLHLSTKASEPLPHAADLPEIQRNTIREFTLYTHNSSFGDKFTLHTPELGGPGTGRSQILGRVQIQFGARSGNSVPIAVSLLNPGGLTADVPVSPITQSFPGRLWPGPQGFNEFLRFPLRSYALDSVTLLPDPFDVAVGAVDVRSGRVIGNLLSRGFISQDIFFALIRVEPRTPRSSFLFRGPALFQKGVDGQTVFRFAGTVMIPYPEGFLFPQPDLAIGMPIAAGSRLDPFQWVHAICDGASSRHAGKRGGASNVIASTGDRFSYSYDIPREGAGGHASFHYENHSQQGSFRMHSLAWVAFANSGSSPESGGFDDEFDTVTFTGFGIWSKDDVSVLRQAAVQISTSPATPYVAIQIDMGTVSNVNTKPPDIASAQP